MFSIEAYAYDWQFDIKFPDGKTETKKVKDSEEFMFKVNENYICTVNLYDDEARDEELFEMSCMGTQGYQFSFMPPESNEDKKTFIIAVPFEKGKNLQMEITVAH
jgi:hypothetical protein